MMRRRSTLILAFAGAASLGLAACGSNSLSTDTKSSTPVTTQTKVASLADKLPAKIKSAGKIIVGSDASYKPNEYLDADGKTVIGMDVDLFNAVAQKFGVTAEFQNASFDSILNNVKGGKYDIGVSSFTINKERLQVVDFVSYLSAGTSWAVAKGNPKNIDIDNACGLAVGVQKGTVQVQDLQARSKKCTDAGKPGINLLIQAEQSKITLDLLSGRLAAMAADTPVVTDAVLSNPDKIEVTGKLYDSAPYGYALAKGQDEFAKAIAQALTELKASGDYDKILTKWKSQDGAVSEFVVNPSVG